VDGLPIPKSVIVVISPYAFHHNELIFSDSFTFNPSRWIASSNEDRDIIEASRKMFSGFSIGPRAYAGKNFTYTELSISIAQTAWYLDIASANGTLEGLGGEYVGTRCGRHRAKEFQLEEHITCCHDGPWLRFRVRELRRWCKRFYGQERNNL
ncbi:cytochrome P450, partial [Patellaria atrata CBS 101060]